jgi:hypothetical protein
MIMMVATVVVIQQVVQQVVQNLVMTVNLISLHMVLNVVILLGMSLVLIVRN